MGYPHDYGNPYLATEISINGGCPMLPKIIDGIYMLPNDVDTPIYGNPYVHLYIIPHLRPFRLHIFHLGSWLVTVVDRKTTPATWHLRCPARPSWTIPKSSPSIPSGKLTVCYWTWQFIVSFPIKIVIFHSYVNVYQRVYGLDWNHP